MKKEEIQLWDWGRILVGNAPVEFMAEVFIRTVLIYLVLLVAMRLLGKRLSTHVSILDMAVTVVLGAIISPGMQLPDRGVVPTVLVLVCVIAFQWAISLLSFKWRKVEVLTQGDVTLLVKNGVIDVGKLKNTAISHEQLFERLRGSKIRNLGQVKRVYLEGTGQFSIFRNAQDKPGLCILPAEDEKVFRGEPRTDRFVACKNCGHVVPTQPSPTPCPRCRADDWDKAVAVPGLEPAPEPGPSEQRAARPMAAGSY
jgi:uncharacterized membrane protein YcaP (DUF421 family)